jgi:hypothetical protein
LDCGFLIVDSEGNMARGNILPHEYAALECAGKLGLKAYRGSLEPGEYPIERAYRLEGVLTVGADTESACSTKPDLVDLTANLLAQFGKSKRAAVIDLLGRGLVEIEPLRTDAARLVELLTVRGRKPRRGAVSGHVLVFGDL